MENSKVLSMLSALYQSTQTLREFCTQASLPGHAHNGLHLIKTTDKPGYIDLLERTVVCTPHCTPHKPGTPPEVPRFRDAVNCLTQGDLVIRAIERIKKREGKGKNLLTLGWSSMSSNPAAQVCGSRNIEYVFPNQHISTLLSSAWKTLLARVGDDLMLHLLETCCVFVPVADTTCYRQITGTPIYDIATNTKSVQMKLAALAKSRSTLYTTKPAQGNSSKHKDGTPCTHSADKHISQKKSSKKRKGGNADNTDSIVPTSKRINISSQPIEHAKSLAPKECSEITIPDDAKSVVCEKRKRIPSNDSYELLNGSKKRKISISKPILNLGESEPIQTESVHGNLAGGYSGLKAIDSNPVVLSGASLFSHNSSQSPANSRAKGTEKIFMENKSLKIGKSKNAIFTSPSQPKVINNSPSDERLSQDSEQSKALFSSVSTNHDRGESEEFPRDYDSQDLDAGFCLEPEEDSPMQDRENHDGETLYTTALEDVSYLSGKSPDTTKTLIESIVGSHSSISSERLERDLMSVIVYESSNQSKEIRPNLNSSQPIKRRRSDVDQSDSKRQRIGDYVQIRKDVKANSVINSPVLTEGNSTQVVKETDTKQGNGQNITQTNEKTINEAKMKENAKQFKQESAIEKNKNGSAYDYHLYFNRSSLLYCKNLTEIFNRKHLLGQSGKDSAQLAKEIVADVLLTRVHSGGADPSIGITCIADITTRLQVIYTALVDNHRKCNYGKTLSYYAPLPSTNTTCQQTNNTATGTTQISTNNTQNKTRNNTDNQTIGVNNKPVLTTSLTNTQSRRLRSAKREHRNRKKLKHSSLDLKAWIACHVPSRQVYLMIRRLYLSVIPVELFGSKHNQQAVLTGLSELLQLGRFDKYCLGQIMRNIKITHIKWLPKKLPHVLKETLVAKVVYWVVQHYVFVILKSYFYITETSAFRNRLFYYRKAVWSKIRQLAIKEYLSRNELEEVKKQSVSTLVSKGLCLGVAHMRFMPKTASVRPIVNMGRKITTGPYKGSTINNQVRSLLQVLVYGNRKDPALIGSSQFGAQDIYNVWRGFVLSRKQRNDNRPLYFVKVDIEKCYDSLDQSLLYDIIHTSLSQPASAEEYIVRRYVTTHLTQTYARHTYHRFVHYLPASPEEYIVRRYVTTHLTQTHARHTYHREVAPWEHFEPDFSKLVREKGKSQMIFADQVLHLYETRTSLLSKLQKHLANNIIQIGKKFYRRLVGISQGSILSTMLCNRYYGDMETRHVTTGNHELLMRQVDDFLLATPDLSNARYFLKLMLYGLSRYNCKVSKEKTLVNFDMSDEPTVPQLPQSALFPWCGLLLHPHTLEALTDYTRYSGLRVTDFVTFDLAARSGHAIKDKLYRSLPQKNQYICLDPLLSCDSSLTLTLTLTRMFTMAAAKLHAIKSLPQKNQYICLDPLLSSDPSLTLTLYRMFTMAAAKLHAFVKRSRSVQSSSFILDVILSLPGHVLHQIRTHVLRRDSSRKSQVLTLGNPITITLIRSLPGHVLHQIRTHVLRRDSSRKSQVLTLGCIKLICLKAFEGKLQKHQGLFHRSLFKELTKQITNTQLNASLRDTVEKTLSESRSEFIQVT